MGRNLELKTFSKNPIKRLETFLFEMEEKKTIKISFIVHKIFSLLLIQTNDPTRNNSLPFKFRLARIQREILTAK